MEEHVAQAHPEYASPRNLDGAKRLPHAVWTSMQISHGEEIALGIPLGKVAAPFTRVAGPDEGVDDVQQAGVRRVPVRTVAPSRGAANLSKRRKGNTGEAVVASGSGSR